MQSKVNELEKGEEKKLSTSGDTSYTVNGSSGLQMVSLKHLGCCQILVKCMKNREGKSLCVQQQLLLENDLRLALEEVSAQGFMLELVESNSKERGL